MIGVAISTTGDEHRLGFLETCVMEWDAHLPENSPIFVTVDGDDAHAALVERTLNLGPARYVAEIHRVGQPALGVSPDLRRRGARDGRLGVATNKNTGIELLVDAGVEHLFLSDDDTWPAHWTTLGQHVAMREVYGIQHSMVCWGRHRKPVRREGYAEWSWPRGSAMYIHESVIGTVGGMIEEFGPGGHEHVEWSRRIHQAGLTPAMYCSPVECIDRPHTLWHAEDMPRVDRLGRVEPLGNLKARRRRLTSVRREPGDWEQIEQIMKARDGDTGYVPFRAHANGRESATLCVNPTSRSAGGEK